MTDKATTARHAIDVLFSDQPAIYSAEERHCRYRQPHQPHDADWPGEDRIVWHPCPGTPGEIKRPADRRSYRFSPALQTPGAHHNTTGAP